MHDIFQNQLAATDSQKPSAAEAIEELYTLRLHVTESITKAYEEVSARRPSGL
jgi:hypothetical protein